MKFLMLMIPRLYQPETPAAERAPDDFVPTAHDLEKMEEMGRFNDALAKAAKVLDIDGLTPPGKGARLTFANGVPETASIATVAGKDVVGGYWIFEIGTMEEALQWARRVPADPGDVIELRPVFEFPAE